MQTLAVETTRYPTHISEASRRVMTRCPATNKLTIRNDNDPLAVPGGQATWWYCSACDGWHVSVEND